VIERTACPSSDILARAASGHAGRAERRVVADHLATCSMCSEEYRVAAALGPWAQHTEAAFDIADLPTYAPHRSGSRWPALSGLERLGLSAAQSLMLGAAALILIAATAALLTISITLRRENARLVAQRQDVQSQQPSAPPPPEVTPRDAQDVAKLEAQAAEIVSLQARLDEALAPALNVPIVDLEPPDTVRGEKTRPAAQVPTTSRLVTFVLTTSTDPRSTDHEIELVGPSGAVVWRAAGLRPGQERTFTVTIPLSLLGNGMSHLRLYRGSNTSRTLVEDYPVRVG
jgi:hypothetical protein